MEVVFTDRTQDYLARVNSHPHLERHAFLQTQPVGVALHLFLHAQGGIEGALRMIFMGNRGTEESKDAIAQRLRDVALIAVHRVHHELEGRINDATGFLRVEAVSEGGKACHISKERSDGLTLTFGSAAGFHRCLLSKDTLRQMLRCVENWF